MSPLEILQYACFWGTLVALVTAGLFIFALIASSELSFTRHQKASRVLFTASTWLAYITLVGGALFVIGLGIGQPPRWQ